jgi:hypothetical protein
MRITVVIPDEAQLVTAGVRIRYRRIEPHLRAAGHQLELVPIERLGKAAGVAPDICLFSKCHDARSLVLARALRREGAAVGIDVFDDYYSDATDSRFVHLREWLRAIAGDLAFALCATPPMRTRLSALLPGLPVHVVRDPCEPFDAEGIAQSAERNLARARESRLVDIGWFGVGDNPHFALGLSDLHAFCGELAELRRWGYRPRLSILTNRRALDRERLEMLARLPVPCRVEEWSADRERNLVSESLFCFLPVNAQPFSTVKSLNRAVTALTGGAQVVSPGYPLYAELEPFIYRDVSALVEDMERGSPALRRETVPSLAALLGHLGEPGVEAAALVRFLAALPRAAAGAAGGALQAVIHGWHSSTAIHKFAQQRGCLSIASPFFQATLDFDVSLGASADGPAVMLSERAYGLLGERHRRHLEIHHRRDGRPCGRLLLSQIDVPLVCDFADMIECREAAVVTTRYRAVMTFLAAMLRELFADVPIVLAENGSPPWADVGATFAPWPAATSAMTDAA